MSALMLLQEGLTLKESLMFTITTPQKQAKNIFIESEEPREQEKKELQ